MGKKGGYLATAQPEIVFQLLLALWVVVVMQFGFCAAISVVSAAVAQCLCHGFCLSPTLAVTGWQEGLLPLQNADSSGYLVVMWMMAVHYTHTLSLSWDTSVSAQSFTIT